MNRLFFLFRYRFVFAFIIALLIFAMARAIVFAIGKPIVTPSTVIPLLGPTSTPGGAWVIQKPEFSDFSCGSDAEVINALITIEISGGVPPYFVQFNSDNTVLKINAAGVGFWLPGGTGSEVRIYDSQEGERNEETIDVYVPTHHSACEVDASTNTATVTITSTATSTNTSTLTPSRVPYQFPTSTRNNLNPAHIPVDPQPTPSPTNPIPPTVTNTSPPPPIATNTPPPPPIATNTPPPPPIATNTPIPGHPECDDGVDNDGDTKVDKNDPECQNKHDTDESR